MYWMVEVGAIIFSMVTTAVVFFTLSSGFLGGTSGVQESEHLRAAAETASAPIGCSKGRASVMEEVASKSLSWGPFTPVFTSIREAIATNPIGCIATVVNQAFAKVGAGVTLLTAINADEAKNLEHGKESGVSQIPFIGVFILIGSVLFAYAAIRMIMFGGD